MKNLSVLVVSLIAFTFNSTAQDTSCGIVWEQPLQLSPGTPGIDELLPSIAIQGDTVHVTWLYGSQRFPYRRSVNGGLTFEPIRELAPAFGEVSSFIVGNGETIFGMFATNDSGNGLGGDSYLLQSTDHGNTWSMPGGRIDSAAWVAYSALQDTFVIVESKLNDGWHIRYTTDGGILWIRRPQNISYTNEPKIALTPGVLHKVVGYEFDSAGVYSEFVVQYSKSSDMGLTWSDSVNLSSMGSRGSEPNIAVDPNSDSSVVFSAWKDVKYGCLSPVGCSVLGRLSYNTGNTFENEQRFDLRPAGALVTLAIRENVIAVGWSDALPDGGVRMTVSFDHGTTWCMPFSIDDGEIWGIGIARDAIHIVYDKVVGGNFRIFYRRGVLSPTSAGERSIGFPPFVSLAQNFPNPFNPTTEIGFQISEYGQVLLQVYDVLGREIETLLKEMKYPGAYKVTWNAQRYSSGVYYYKITTQSPLTGMKVFSKKMVLMR